MTESAAAVWQRYLGTLPAEHPHHHARPDTFAFGDSPALANELAALVQVGRKRATASLPVEFTSLGLPMTARGTAHWPGGRLRTGGTSVECATGLAASSMRRPRLFASGFA